MGMFKADNPAKQFAKDEAATRKLRADHVAELDKYQAAHAEAEATVARLLDEGAGQGDIETAQVDRSRAADAITDRKKAIDRTDKRLAEIAAELAKHELGKRQNEYAVEVERRVSVLEARTQALLNSIAEWIPAAEEVAEICLDAGGLPPYGQKSLIELPPAVAMAAETVRGRIIPDVLAGNKPPVIAAKPALVPPPDVIVEKCTAWLALQPLRHQSAAGVTMVARYDVAYLNDAQVRMGLEGFEQKVIIALDDERVPALRKRQITQQRPNENQVFDLDAGTAPAGIVYTDLSSRAPRYTLPPTFTPAASSDVQLPKVAARKQSDENDK